MTMGFDERMPPVFITGTDTGVGKTVVSAWLCFHWRATYWKPIQCGMDEETDRAFVARTAGVDTIMETYCLKTPASPHYAAHCEQKTIELADFSLPSVNPPLVIEGAGGVEVPLNDHACIGDLITRLGVPALIVARGSLGTINHCLLTIAALQRRDVPILGIVLTGVVRPENAPAIYAHSGIRVIAELPLLPEFSQAAFASNAAPELRELTANRQQS